MRSTLALATCSALLVATPAPAIGSPPATSAGPGTAAPIPTAAARPDVPAAARLVARRDVDGDGDRDRIFYRAITRTKVRVSVRLSPRRVVRKTLRTHSWPRGHFHGAARLDGRRGVELVIGTALGAHTPWFTVLTYRNGRLVKQKPPYRGLPDDWPVDAYANGYVGWFRKVRGGSVRLAYKYVTRVGATPRFTGRAIRYTWRHGRWERTGARRLSFPNARRASRIGGWHVKGLPRWPR